MSSDFDIQQYGYRPRGLFRWRHFNTIYPTLFRRLTPLDGQRKRFKTEDNDFFDVDIFLSKGQRIAVLLHGLEGSARSSYIQGLTRYLVGEGWDVAAMNFRGCSGVSNRTERSYHSGFTDDVDLLVRRLAESYTLIALIGFSLGGSIVLNYLGRKGTAVPPAVKTGVVISTPLDLSSSGVELEKPHNAIYIKRFLLSLKKKAEAKKAILPSKVDLTKVRQATTIRMFDEYFTAPIHGFSGAEDYYRQCSGQRWLGTLDRPTLILNARDDPFLSPHCYPDKIHDPVMGLYPENGGHVGFAHWGKGTYWSEMIVGKYLSGLGR